MVQKILIVAVIVGCILGYGYWHSSTHGSFHVGLLVENASEGKLEALPGADVIFLDSGGQVLAEGISDAQYNYVRLIHPEVGDCHKLEQLAPFSKQARRNWQECFEQLSTWIPEWAGQVRYVEIRSQFCLWRHIPVTTSKSGSDWYLWWVPHPHIGGKPYSYYSLSITVEESACEESVHSRFGGKQ